MVVTVIAFLNSGESINSGFATNVLSVHLGSFPTGDGGLGVAGPGLNAGDAVIQELAWVDGVAIVRLGEIPALSAQGGS